MEYNFREIEKKWQKRWVENGTYRVVEDEKKKKERKRQERKDRREKNKQKYREIRANAKAKKAGSTADVSAPDTEEVTTPEE